MNNTPPAEGSRATGAPGPRDVKIDVGTDRPESHVPLADALRALEARLEAVTRATKAIPASEAAGQAVPPAGRVTVALLALPAEGGPPADSPFSPDDPLPPPAPPLAPVFLVAADHADHHAAVASLGAVLASFSASPLLPFREPQGFLRVDRVDLELADALALRNAAGLAITVPFALLRVRGISLPTPFRPERVTHDRENPREVLDVKRQIEETLRRGLDHFAFLPNTPETWVAVRGMALSVLHDFRREGRIPWPSPLETYSAYCGLGQTMTANDVLEGRLILTCQVADPTQFDGKTLYSDLALTFELQMQA